MLFKLVYQIKAIKTVDFINDFVYNILMVLESTVSIAKVGTKSVRATVPEGIVSYLELEVGDKLEWRMDTKNNERVAIVSKKRDPIKSRNEPTLKEQMMKEDLAKIKNDLVKKGFN
jgi:bifunctional DNA-binding transcriptional regulator/antitoxin component of YhaV-PrlF toxin-antitoxin module